MAQLAHRCSPEQLCANGHRSGSRCPTAWWAAGCHLVPHSRLQVVGSRLPPGPTHQGQAADSGLPHGPAWQGQAEGSRLLSSPTQQNRGLGCWLLPSPIQQGWGTGSRSPGLGQGLAAHQPCLVGSGVPTQQGPQLRSLLPTLRPAPHPTLWRGL